MEIKNRIDISDEQGIIKLIKADYLKRKIHLNSLIQLFNNISEPIVVGIDGEWGTGKTIFLKQFEVLINNEEEIESVNFDNLTEFKLKNKVFYFNSWENDIYDNPLQSLLFSLAKKYKNDLNEKEYDMSKIFNFGKTLINLGLKLASSGAVGLEDFTIESEDKNQLIDSILTVEEIKKEIDKFLRIITDEKKLIIIVDELDRCKPTFAIELLEVIKHYFLHNNVHFILCSNKSELSHTVRKYYGQDFNGYEYLDRFIDFEYNLPSPDRIEYAKNVLGVRNTDFFYVSHAVVDYFRLSLRQINKYVLNTEVILGTWPSYGSSQKDQELLFLFYFSGLNIKNKEDAKSFIDGDGFEKFKAFCSENINELDYLINSSEEDYSASLKIRYDSIFNYKKANTHSYELENFLNLLSRIV